MWVRMLVFPGGARITGMEVIPVAVDTHVQRVTEMLGLVAVQALDGRHRTRIQRVWFDAVRLAGRYEGPPGIDGTAAGIDPALWALGRTGLLPLRAGTPQDPGWADLQPVCAGAD